MLPETTWSASWKLGSCRCRLAWGDTRRTRSIVVPGRLPSTSWAGGIRGHPRILCLGWRFASGGVVSGGNSQNNSEFRMDEPQTSRMRPTGCSGSVPRSSAGARGGLAVGGGYPAAPGQGTRETSAEAGSPPTVLSLFPAKVDLRLKQRRDGGRDRVPEVWSCLLRRDR